MLTWLNWFRNVGRASNAAESERSFCITDTELLMHIMLYNIPGEWSYSTDLMWEEQEVLAKVIGVGKSASVRRADRTLNDSWCQAGYLWTLNLRPTEQAGTQLLSSSESRGENPLHDPLLLCCIRAEASTKYLIPDVTELWFKCSYTVLKIFWVFEQIFYAFDVLNYVYPPLYVHFSPPASSSPLYLSGRAHGALSEALVDGDGHYSSWDGGLCISCLPPLSHHHLLQGYQKVRRHPCPLSFVF